MIDEKAAEMRRKYLQEWRKKNPEKVKKYNLDYWKRKAAKLQNEGDNNGQAENC